MNSFLDSETPREREDPKRGSPRFRAKLNPCLARMRREQKAASKGARFGVHFTQIVTFPAAWIPKAPSPTTFFSLQHEPIKITQKRLYRAQ